MLDRFELVAGPLPGESRRVPLDIRILEVERLSGYTRTRLTLAAEPGDRVSACLLVPHGLPVRAPAVLCLHQTTAMGKREPAGMGLPNLAYAAELVALAPDYPGFGESRTDPYALG